MKDSEIIACITGGNTARAFEAIYKNFPSIRKMVIASGGSPEDAKDVFQDSIIVFYNLCRRKDFVLTASVSTLIYSISKKIWYKKIRDHHSRVCNLISVEVEDNTPWEYEEEEELDKIKVAENILQQLGEPCRSILVKFYYEKLSMQEIASLLGYSNENTAKAQKYKCMERGKKILKEKWMAIKKMIL